MGGFKDAGLRTWTVNVIGIVQRVDAIFPSKDYHTEDDSKSMC